MITDAMIKAAWEAIHGPIGEDEADTRIIEMPTKAVVKKALEAALSAMWQPIETAPKGTDIFVIELDYENPFIAHWEDYDEIDAAEFGEEGYWCPTEEILADIMGMIEPTMWAPLFLPAREPPK